MRRTPHPSLGKLAVAWPRARYLHKSEPLGLDGVRTTFREVNMVKSDELLLHKLKFVLCPDPLLPIPSSSQFFGHKFLRYTKLPFEP